MSDSPRPVSPKGDSFQPLARICEKHHGELVGSLRRQTGSLEAAKDIAQDAYLRGLGNTRPKTDEHHRYALFLTARRRAIDWLRKQRYRNQRRTEMLSEQHPGSNELEMQVLTEEQNQLLHQVLTELPTKYRLIIRWGVLDDIPQKEIAHRLGRSTRSIRTYQDHALTYCALRLNGYSESDAKRRVKL